MQFRDLTPEEQASFRQWARDNDTPEWRAKAEILHPIVRDEWSAMDAERMVAEAREIATPTHKEN